MVVAGYADDLDVSASKMSPWERPQLGWWLRHPDRFDAIIFRSVDRLARRVGDFAQFLEWADEHGIHLVCLSPDIDFSTPVGRMLAYLLAMFADMEARAISERVTGAREFMRGQERWPAGRPPYGYRLCPHRSGRGYGLEPDPETAPIIEEAVRRVIEGESVTAVTIDFNKRGIEPPSEVTRRRKRESKADSDNTTEEEETPPSVWYQTGLRYLLRNSALRNHVVHNGRIQRGEDGSPLRYGNSIVSDGDWRLLQAALDGATPAKTWKRVNSAPLVGVIHCAQCRYRMYQTRNAKNGKVWLRYTCVSNRLKNTECDGAGVRAEEAEEFVEREFMRAVGSLRIVVRVEDPGEDHGAEIRELEDALGELERDRYEGGLYRGDDGRQRFRDQYARIEGRLEALRAMPFRAPTVRLEETGLTYAQEWELSDWPTRRARLIERGAVLLVRGKGADGPADERLTFEARGFSDDNLAEQGHDETDPREHW